MLLYTDIVNKALNREALPILKNVVESALTEYFGNDWYHQFGRNILLKYKDFLRIEQMMTEENRKVMDCLDVTALFFLLTPYYIQEDKTVHFEGALPIVAEYAHLSEGQARRLDRIRVIRNNVSHDKCDTGIVLDDAAIKSGREEKKWLTEIEEILKFFKPEETLFDYHRKLSEEVARELESHGEKKNVSTYISGAEAVRTEFRKVNRFDFSEAPIQEPINGASPWAVSISDLEDLPWPSLAAAAEESAAQTADGENMHQTNSETAEKQNSNIWNGVVTEEAVHDAIDRVSDQLDKGVSKLFGWLGGRK